MTYALEIKNLSHQFGKQKVLDDISINFEENKIYGLLGKNGAGKTTLINLLTTQLLHQQGEIKILGRNPQEDISVLDSVCVVREKELFNQDLQVKNIFEMYRYFYKDYDRELEKVLCEEFNIPVKKHFKKLSRGMKTTVSNIIGICANAPITIFDEPTTGLDAAYRQEFYRLLLESYVENPRTIIISTHQIDEVEELLEKVVLIHEQKVLIDDDLELVREKSYYISGKKEELAQLEILRDAQPEKNFGSIGTYAYYGELTRELFGPSIELEQMSLQNLFIHLTKEKNNEK